MSTVSRHLYASPSWPPGFVWIADTSAPRVPSGECCFSIASNAEREVVRHASSGPYSDFTCAWHDGGPLTHTLGHYPQQCPCPCSCMYPCLYPQTHRHAALHAMHATPLMQALLCAWPRGGFQHNKAKGKGVAKHLCIDAVDLRFPLLR